MTIVNSTMPNDFDRPRILIVTPEIACVPCGREGRSIFTATHAGELAGRLGRLVDGLYDRGADMHVAQPDYRQIFRHSHPEVEIFAGKKIPDNRIHLAEDRTFYYSNYLGLNEGRENVKIAIAFQREVINQIIPRVQPDLIHCHDWMTGLIPAVARKLDIRCLFSVYRVYTMKILLSYLEDMGIDTAAFWQHLYFCRYPLNYEETRETNPLDFLLSGIFAAHFVSITNPDSMLPKTSDRNDFFSGSIKRLLDEKWKTRCLKVNHSFRAGSHIEIYEKMLQCPVIQTKRKIRRYSEV